MQGNNLIQWPTAKYWTTQWNPVIGCKPCSPACANCYAEAWAKRFKQSFEPHSTKQYKPPRKGVVFCGNITDLFGDWMWPWCQGSQFIHASPAHLIGACCMRKGDAKYLWLTKRAEAMTEVLRWAEAILGISRNSDNQYFGFTAENQEWYDKRMATVTEGAFPDWANLWLSCEPLLGPINLKLDNANVSKRLKQVIVGCESGKNRRTCEIQWIREIVRQCMKFNVPVFVKQICLPNGKFTSQIEAFPSDIRVRQLVWG